MDLGQEWVVQEVHVNITFMSPIVGCIGFVSFIAFNVGKGKSVSVQRRVYGLEAL